jgi:hypothetical protein
MPPPPWQVFFNVAFTAELAIKLLGLGSSYFRSRWNRLDCLIVVVGWITLLFEIPSMGVVKVSRAGFEPKEIQQLGGIREPSGIRTSGIMTRAPDAPCAFRAGSQPASLTLRAVKHR